MAIAVSLPKWHILCAFMMALVLQAIPLPATLSAFQPEWVLLMVIYWSMFSPYRLGFFIVWFVGLLQDILLGVYMGQYAIIYLVIAYSLFSLHLRIRVYPLWKQSFIALGFIILAKCLLSAAQLLTDSSVIILNPLKSIIVTFLLWYVVLFLMDRLFKRVSETQTVFPKHSR